MDDALSLVLSVLVLMASMITRPTRAWCPSGWVVSTGVSDGAYLCQPERIGCDYLDHVCEQPPGFIAGRVFCAPGFVPALTHEADGVRCQRQPEM